MPKLEDVLKAQGLSDEDIAALAPTLADPKLRGAIEGRLETYESERTSFMAENQAWAEYNEQHFKPEIAKREQEALDARTRAATLAERLKMAEEKGFAPAREEPVVKTPDPAAAFDPKAHNLITRDDIGRFADIEGEAIAMANDLSEEYRMLTGNSILSYTARTQDGRELRGMRALREEAKTAKQNLDVYITQKFDFAGKRAAIAEKQRLAAEEAIRADERTKMAAQYGNPNTRQLLPSKEPFIPKPRTADSKPPWEIPSRERQRARIERAMQSQITNQVN